MTISFIKKSDKTVTHYASFDTETREQELKIEQYYIDQVKSGKIYGYSVIS